MTVLKSVLRDIIRPVLRPILRGPITRFFTTLVASGSMYYTIPTVTLAGDYKISVLVYFSGSTLRVTGRVGTFSGRIELAANGGIGWAPANEATTVDAPSGSVPLNNLSIIEVERIGSNGTIKINGTTVFSGAVPTGSLSVNLLARQSSSFSDGILADVSISGDSLASRFYPLDENFGETTVAIDTISGQNGTAINISESGDYELNADKTVWISLDGGTDLDIAPQA